MIRQLWSPTGLLRETLHFRPGLNLIIGRYDDEPSSENINGIGKSTVVRLIDYLLLSGSAAKLFATARYSFMKQEDHEICLDLEIQGKTLRIRRRFADKDNVFLQREGEGENAYTLNEANLLLNRLFFPTDEWRQLPGARFRSLMPFFVKDDVNHQTRVDPVKFIHHQGVNQQELMTLNLFLLGLPSTPLVRMGEWTHSLKETRKDMKRTRERIEELTGKKIQALRTELGTQQKELARLQASLGQLDQMEDFDGVAHVLTDIDGRISVLRRKVERGDRQLSRLQRFVRLTEDVDVTDVSEQYAMVSSALGDMVRKSLKDVMAFRRSLVEERLRFHGEQLRGLEAFRREAMNELKELEGRRAALLRSVGEDTGTSLQEAFARLAKRQVEVERVASSLEDIAKANIRLEEQSREAELERHHTVEALRASVERIESIRERFIDIVSRVIRPDTEEEWENAWLEVEARSGSINKQPVDIKVKVPREDALGRNRLSLVAYDFTVFLNSVAQALPLPRFLIHDGVYHGISRRTVVDALNYVVAQENDLPHEPFQYIATFNEDELSVEDFASRDGAFTFDVAEKTLITLTPEKRLLGRSFA